MRPPRISTLQLFVYIPNDQMIALNHVSADTSIRDIKSKLELRTGILAELQDLFVNNIKTRENETLSFLKIKSGTLLRVKFREKSFRNIFVDAFKGDSRNVLKHEIEAVQACDEVGEVLNKIASLKAFQAAFTACFKGHLTLLRSIIEKNSSVVNNATKNGRSLLHIAADAGNLSCVSLLLKKGSELGKSDKDGFTALHLATANSHWKCEKHISAYSWKFGGRDQGDLHFARDNLGCHQTLPPISLQNATYVSKALERNELIAEQLPFLESASNQALLKKPITEELLAPAIQGDNENQIDQDKFKVSSGKRLYKIFRPRSAPHLQTFSENQSEKIIYLVPKSKVKDSEHLKVDGIKQEIPGNGSEELLMEKIQSSSFNDSHEENNNFKIDRSFQQISEMNKVTFMHRRSHDFTLNNDRKIMLKQTCCLIENKEFLTKNFRLLEKNSKLNWKNKKTLKKSKNAKGREEEKVLDAKLSEKQDVLNLLQTKSNIAKEEKKTGDYSESSFSVYFSNVNFARDENNFQREIDLLKSNDEILEKTSSFDHWLHGIRKPKQKLAIDSNVSSRLVISKKTCRVRSFEYWLEIQSLFCQKTSISIHRSRRREVKRMTFEEWKLWKKQSQNKKQHFEEPRSVKHLKSTAVSFETWLERKRADEAKKKRQRAELESKKQIEMAFTRNSRLSDPRQRTFNEWVFEKKSQQRYQIIKHPIPKIIFPEDNELIFNLWLLDKFKAEIQVEKDLLMKVRRSR